MSNNIGVDSIIGVAVVAGWSWFVFDVILNDGLVVAEESQTAPYEQAASDVMGVIPWVMAVVIGISLGLWVGPHIYYKAKKRKEYSLTTFGPRRSTESYDKGQHNFTDERCVNCSKPLATDGGMKNVAEEWNVIAGFELTRNHRIETLECHECHNAGWFDYAMRSGEYDNELLEPPEEETETAAIDSESNDTPNSEGPECPICGKGPFKNEHGKRVHIGQSHPSYEIRCGVVCLKDRGVTETEKGNRMYLTGDGTENHD